MTMSNQTDRCDDGPRIDVNDYFDLRSWAKRFGVTAGEVRRAVSRVGDRPQDVEAYLARPHAPHEAQEQAQAHG